MKLIGNKPKYQKRNELLFYNISIRQPSTAGSHYLTQISKCKKKPETHENQNRNRISLENISKRIE